MAKRPGQSRVLDYGRPPAKDPLWFRLLVLFGCGLGLFIIVAVVANRVFKG